MAAMAKGGSTPHLAFHAMAQQFGARYCCTVHSESTIEAKPNLSQLYLSQRSSAKLAKLNFFKIPSSVGMILCVHRVDRVLGFFSSRPNWDSVDGHDTFEIYLQP